MLTLQNAFVGESVAQTMTMIVKGSYPPLKPAVGGQQCDEKLAALLDMLLSVDKAGRPTAAAALGAPLLGPSLAEYKLQTQRGQQLLGNSTALSLPSARVAPDWDGDLDAMERLLASVVLDDEGFAETPGLLDEGFEAELDRAAGELEHHGRPARRICESVDDVLRGRLSAAETTAAVAHLRARRAGAAAVGSRELLSSISSLSRMEQALGGLEDSGGIVAAQDSSVGLGRGEVLASRGSERSLDLDEAEWLVRQRAETPAGHPHLDPNPSPHQEAAPPGCTPLAMQSSSERWSGGAAPGSARSMDLDELERLVGCGARRNPILQR